jgi:Flp pilus assembly protein TadG
MGRLKPSIESRARTGLRGQSLVEFVMVMPLVLVLLLGIIEVSYALFENHLIIKLAREGANLISRGTNLGQAETSLLAATTAPVAFNAKGKLVLSVIKLGDAGSNLNRPIISQRGVVGTLSANSVLGNPPTSSYAGPPYYTAVNPNNDPNIRIAGALPNGLTLAAGQSVYVTEVYTRHDLITPLRSFGVTLPTNLYASAFF